MLNPTLYKLVERWAHGNVTVVNEDVSFVPSYEPRVAEQRKGSRRRRGGMRMERKESGEEYRVCCPICGDTRNRLYINHRWGVYDEKSRSRNLWLAHCWNNECYSSYTQQKDLYDKIYNKLQLHQTDLIERTRRPSKLEGVGLPGPVRSLEELVRKVPGHHALKYLRDRLLDPLYLARRHEVCYCLESPDAWARDRIIAPIYHEGKMCSWQARCIGEPDNKSVPRWYTCPNTKKSKLMYNLDVAKHSDTVVIVEGPGDVWNFGPQAAAILGKVISLDQVDLLAERIREDAQVVLLLDPEIDKVAIKRGRKHHIELSLERMSRCRRFRDKVLAVYLPAEYDPGELDREYMRDVIRWHADKKKLIVKFGKPSKSAA